MTALSRAVERSPSPWLFGRSADLQVFGGSAVASLLLVAIGGAIGIARGDAPAAMWLVAVLGVDVAHVWSTVYRTYADPAELRRRPLLYFGSPIAVYALGVALHLASGALFWRVLAYAAVFHFVRQQYGWVALYRRRARDRSTVGRRIDALAVYLATVGPLVFWHAASPRRFHWFVDGDFAIGLPPQMGTAALAAEGAALSAYVARATWQALRGDMVSWGKHIVVASTALCWGVGIVVFDSDYVFTATNVLIHGVPYVALVWRYGRGRWSGQGGTVAELFRIGWPAVYAVLVALAFVEEGLWDNLVWHDHPKFFGDVGLELGRWALAVVVPLLAVPQGVHYVLDGFIWRVGPRNPQLAERLGVG